MQHHTHFQYKNKFKRYNSINFKRSFNCINRIAEAIVISQKEYEGTNETIELLQDSELMKQVLESEKSIKAGKIKKFEYK